MITVFASSFGVSLLSAKVLFLAQYNDSTADADYAVGSTTASGAASYPVAGTTGAGEGKWGRGLDQRTDGDGRCAYQGLGNLDPLKGTADFWFILDEYYPATNVQPVFGWWNPPGPSVPTNTFYTHISGAYNYLGFFVRNIDPNIPDAAYETSFVPTVGQWYHMEINWDCTGGDGDSTYNVYIDGQSIIRKTGWDALGSAGGEIRVGIWGFFEGYFLHGRMDELRITDQIEHLSNFTPPTQEYEIPGTAAGAAEYYEQLLSDTNDLQQDISNLAKAIEITQWTPESCQAATVQSSSMVVAQQSTDSLQTAIGQLRQSYLIDSGLQDTLMGELTVTAAPNDPPLPDPCQQGWLPGNTSPTYWSIDTPSPNSVVSIDFTAPLVNQNFDPNINDALRKLRTSSYSNSYWAGVFMGGTPTLTIDPNNRTIEISFQPPGPQGSETSCAAVSGLQGSSGTLEQGDWLLFSNEPGALFALPFYVSCSGQNFVSDLSGPSGAPDCRVNFFDFALLADDWQIIYITADLQQMADDWLGCNDVGCP